MDYKNACNVLDINEKHTDRQLKIAYYKLALKYHPDKNINNKFAGEKFKKINEAYDFLQNNKCQPAKDYLTMMRDCIKYFTPDMQWDDVFLDTTLNNVIDKCGKLSLKVFEKMEKDKCIELYKFISKNKDIFGISDDIIDNLKKILKNKVKNDNIVILNPTLKDILSDSVYKLDLLGKTFYVPLWHHEVVFDHSGQDIIIQCLPELGENIYIDNKNNLHCNFTFDIKNTLNNKEILLLLGEKSFKIPSNLLFVQRTQSYVLRNQGILLIDDNHLYSTEKRGNIYVDIIFE